MGLLASVSGPLRSRDVKACESNGGAGLGGRIIAMDSYSDTRTRLVKRFRGGGHGDLSWTERHEVGFVEPASCVGTCSHALSPSDPLPPDLHAPHFPRGCACSSTTLHLSSSPTCLRLLMIPALRRLALQRAADLAVACRSSVPVESWLLPSALASAGGAWFRRAARWSVFAILVHCKMLMLSQGRAFFPLSATTSWALGCHSAA